jgi:hypothetical protein
MKTIIKSAALFGAVSLLAACGGDESSDNSVGQNYHDIRATLQGSVFNAIDGNRITDESLKITLVQGSDYRNASVRKGTAEFAGDYAIGGIPTSASGGNLTYRIVSTVTGFQPFEATMAFNVSTTGSLQDNRVNRIGNIYMYPLGSFASDVKVNVTFNNEPVEGASVLLNPQTNNNAPTSDTSNTLFAAAAGFLGAQTVVTDASGVATFTAASLVLGGQYSIDVLPTTHEGSQLALNAGTITVVGTDNANPAITNNNINITMIEVAPGNDNGLYVTSASNFDTDAVTATGILTIGFSRAVSLVDEKDIGATLTNANTAALNISDNPNSTVEATLSADGLTLTLTPKYSVAPIEFAVSSDGTDNAASADNNLKVNYTNVFVRIADATDSAVTYNVFTVLNDETGNNPSNTVQTTKAF